MKINNMDNVQFLQLIKNLSSNPTDYSYMLQGYIDEKLHNNTQQTLNAILLNQFKINTIFENYVLNNNQLQYQVSLNDNIQGDNMKNITLRKDGRYSIRKMINGTTIQKYARTKEEARQILQQIKKGKIKVEDKKERINNYTLEEYSKLWLETYKKPFIKSKSYSAIKNFIIRINKALGQIKLKDLTTKQIQEYLNTLPRSRGKEKICLYFNAVLQKAVDTGIINLNVFNAVIKDKKMLCKNNAYTYAEQVAILTAVAGTDIEHEILIYLMCGCRPNELPQKANFDFANNLINIYGTKNDNALHRQIEMSEIFSKYIQEYFNKHEVQAERYVSRKFREICLSIHIENPLLYKLRHTFATNHFTLGTPPKQVQEWLGHSKISMTLDTYTDIDKTSSKEKIKKLYNNFYYIKD